MYWDLADTTSQAIRHSPAIAGRPSPWWPVGTLLSTLALLTHGRTLAERVAAANEHDAAERRLTELYIKSVEQLGSAKAPVRLVGMHSLERVAQDNPAHRQTVTDVICAYLRMPYAPPIEPAGRDLASNSESAPHLDVPKDLGTTEGTDSSAHEKLQVRRAAQRILTNHLLISDPDHRKAAEPPDAGLYPKYWNVTLDLTGAHLVDFELNDCRLNTTLFSRATFAGDASFMGTSFTGGVWFTGGSFTGEAWFSNTCFSSEALFVKVAFAGSVTFMDASFAEDPKFTKARTSDNEGQWNWPTGWNTGVLKDGWRPIERAPSP
ncbi:pentapeptide repeat-containing protein [Longispora urticae]